MRAKASSRDLALLVVVVLVVLNLGGSEMQSTTPKGLVPKHVTGEGSQEAWARARLAALALHGITGDVALSIVAQWALETAYGSAEWNYNVGNVIATSTTEPQVKLDAGAGNPAYYRAYNSLDEAVASYIALVSGQHYAECWHLLQSAPTSDEWIRCMGKAGYYTASQDRYAAAWTGARAHLVSLGVA